MLETIGDGVTLVDEAGVVRLWNRAAETITGIRRDAIVGRGLADHLRGWERVSARAETLPLERDGDERWISVSSVRFDEGTVYAFHDITEDHALERLRQDLVATVSHELRTPLAAIYGSAITLNREDIDLQQDVSAKLLNVIVDESARLTGIVNDLLLASQLDTGRLRGAHRELRRARTGRECRRGGAHASPQGRPGRARAGPGRRPRRRGRRGSATPGARQPARQRRQVLAREAATSA